MIKMLELREKEIFKLTKFKNRQIHCKKLAEKQDRYYKE